jgi:cytochrome c-type biogenesis protein CcmF
MITELGHFALILALAVALVRVMADLRHAEAVIFALCVISFLSLTHAYVISDFSVLNVVRNSHTLKPMLYKISGVWGNHEGSMLLWILMLSGWGFFMQRYAGALAEDAVKIAGRVQAALVAAFTAFILLTSNPFLRLLPPAPEGMDLNPLLQDPGLAFHPPLLYAGYVGFSAAFSHAVAALWLRRVDRGFAAAIRPWVLAAWVFLTLGIALGSLWAYYELGWGGFWFWDPVENASLLPWLAGLALLHSAAVTATRGSLAGWTLFLSILSFSLALLGTFLVRSGVLTSVHSFAADPSRGIFILAILAAAVGGALLLYALRAPQLRAGVPFRPVSRETVLLLNNVFLFSFAATVFIGTLYPLFMAALEWGSVSVGAPYYKMVMLPMLFPFAFLLGAASYVPWRRGDTGKITARLLEPLVLAGFVFFLILFGVPALAVAGFMAAAWIVAAALFDLKDKKITRLSRRYAGMTLAHVGFAVMIAGVTGATQMGTEKILWMAAGDNVMVAGKKITFLGADMTLGKNYNADRGVFSVDNGFLTPERRWYPAAEKQTTETAIDWRGLNIFYVVLGDRDVKNPARWVVRVYHHPLLVLIFAGAGLMAAGGALSWSERRKS